MPKSFTYKIHLLYVTILISIWAHRRVTQLFNKYLIVDAPCICTSSHCHHAEVTTVVTDNHVVVVADPCTDNVGGTITITLSAAVAAAAVSSVRPINRPCFQPIVEVLFRTRRVVPVAGIGKSPAVCCVSLVTKKTA